MKQWSDMKMSDKLLSLKVARQSNPKMTYWQLRDLLSDNKYDNGKQSESYNNWRQLFKTKFNRDPESKDYDTLGFYKEDPNRAYEMLSGKSDAHFTDSWKLPNHVTFNQESYYDTRNYNTLIPLSERLLGGEWLNLDNDRKYTELDPLIFNESDRNMENNETAADEFIWEKASEGKDYIPLRAVYNGANVLPSVYVTPNGNSSLYDDSEYKNLSKEKYDKGKDSFDFLDNSIENVLGLLNLQLSTPDNIVDTTPSKIITPVTLSIQLYKMPIEKLLYDENNQPYPIVTNSKFLLKYKNIDTHLVDLVDDTLSNAGLNDVQRAVIMGHIMLESKFNPNTYNSAKTRTGFILNDKTRMLLIQLYAKIINHTKEDYPGLNEVLKMIYDIKNASTNKKSSINQWLGDDKLFMNTSDPSKLNDLVNEFGLHYIRDGKDGTLNKRIKYALDALDYIKSRLK